MNFRTKMTWIFVAFIMAIALGIGIFYYQLVNRQYVSENRQMLEFYGKTISENMDHNIDFMLEGINYILSSPDVLDSLHVMMSYHTSASVSEYYRQDAIRIINKSIYTSYINANFYRIIIFNRYGDILANKNYGVTAVDLHRDIQELPWLEQCNENRSATVIIGKHIDDWGSKENPMVYSVVKKLYGSTETYIEIQVLAEETLGNLDVENQHMEVAVFNPDKQPMIELAGEEDYSFQQYSQLEEGIYEESGKRILVCQTPKYGMTIVVAQDNEAFLSRNLEIIKITLSIIAIFAAASMLYVACSVRYLTKPIYEMKKMIDETELSNLDDPKRIELPVNELEALNYSYRRLLERLREQMIKEQKMAVINLQAQLDILQAQVNPHFIYNVLNVISSRGMLSGDEEICNLCGSLASMLRYTTNTKERNAAIQEELYYVEKYCYLLKSRYSHKIKVEIVIAEDMKKIVIPKMVLQQIIENCVEHGFCEDMLVLEIGVRGERIKEGWQISIRDNGNGFQEEKIEELYQLFQLIEDQLNNEEELYESEIGGMGLANSYARMFFMFGKQFSMKLENRNGSEVTLLVKEGEDSNV